MSLWRCEAPVSEECCGGGQQAANSAKPHKQGIIRGIKISTSRSDSPGSLSSREDKGRHRGSWLYYSKAEKGCRGGERANDALLNVKNSIEVFQNDKKTTVFVCFGALLRYFCRASVHKLVSSTLLKRSKKGLFQSDKSI